MRWNRQLFLLPALLAALAVAAAATPIGYSFSATTEPLYTWFGVESTGPLTITGTFTADGTNLLAWSFDFSPLEGYQESDDDNGNTSIQPFDVNGSYVLNNQNSVVSNQSYNGAFGWSIYAVVGDGTAVAANPGSYPAGGPSVAKLYSSLDIYFDTLPGPLVGDGSGADGQLDQGYFSNNGGYQEPPFYGAFFSSGQATQVTPEPPSWTLAGAGMLLGGLVLWSDRKRRAAVRA